MSPVASITSNGPAWVMVPTQVAESKRTVGCPALWSMRKLPLAKVAPSMARPGFSVPPALMTPVTMMVPGPEGLVDTTWKYSVWAALLGAHVDGPAPGRQPPAAEPGHPVCEDQVEIRDALVALAGEAAATATKAVLTAAAARMAVRKVREVRRCFRLAILEVIRGSLPGGGRMVSEDRRVRGWGDRAGRDR